MLFVVVGTGLMAEIAAHFRAAQRPDGAAAGPRGAYGAACRRAADRADGFTAAHAGAGRQAEHAGHRKKRYERLQHMYLLVKMMGSGSRLRCSRAAGR